MVQPFVLFWTVFEQFSGQEYMVLHPVEARVSLEVGDEILGSLQESLKDSV